MSEAGEALPQSSYLEGHACALQLQEIASRRDDDGRRNQVLVAVMAQQRLETGIKGLIYVT